MKTLEVEREAARAHSREERTFMIPRMPVLIESSDEGKRMEKTTGGRWEGTIHWPT